MKNTTHYSQRLLEESEMLEKWLQPQRIHIEQILVVNPHGHYDDKELDMLTQNACVHWRVRSVCNRTASSDSIGCVHCPFVSICPSTACQASGADKMLRLLLYQGGWSSVCFLLLLHMHTDCLDNTHLLVLVLGKVLILFENGR